MRAVGERDGQQAALLDEENRDAPLPDRCEHAEERLDDGGREPQRGLVEQQDVRSRDEGARDRKLLLLAARQRAGGAVSRLGNDGEEVANPGEVGGEAPSLLRRPERPSFKFSSTVSDGKMWRPSGTSATPERAICSGAPRSGAPRSRISPRWTGTRPMIALSVVDLPAPLGPISPTISPRSTRRLRSRTAATAP